MKELELKYGCNPNQKPSKIFTNDGRDLPIQVLNGKPGYINFMDALNSWQLVKELKAATGLPAAASFKHVSPAGAAVAKPMSDTLKKIYFVDDLELSPIATAYARARGADRMSSYGDWAALSDVCDKETATHARPRGLGRHHRPGLHGGSARDPQDEAQGQLQRRADRPGLQAGADRAQGRFRHHVEQGRNELKIDAEMLNNIVTENKTLPEEAKLDLVLSLITLKYTQSNSVCYAKDGQAIGIGAGQQSRIHCTRLAGNKADIWYLRQHEKVLNLPFKADIRRPDRDNTIDVYISDECDDVLRDGAWQQFFTERPAPLTREEMAAWLRTFKGVSVGSDAFFPFGDNIERARKSGVEFHRAAGRLDPRRQRDRYLQQVRHRDGVHRHPPVPPLIAGGGRHEPNSSSRERKGVRTRFRACDGAGAGRQPGRRFSAESAERRVFFRPEHPCDFLISGALFSGALPARTADGRVLHRHSGRRTQAGVVEGEGGGFCGGHGGRLRAVQPAGNAGRDAEAQLVAAQGGSAQLVAYSVVRSMLNWGYGLLRYSAVAAFVSISVLTYQAAVDARAQMPQYTGGNT